VAKNSTHDDRALLFSSLPRSINNNNYCCSSLSLSLSMAAPSSDINAFFAKRDARKKKKATTASKATTAAGTKGAGPSAAAAASGATSSAAAPVAKPSSDWREPATQTPLAPPPVVLSKQLVNLHSYVDR